MGNIYDQSQVDIIQGTDLLPIWATNQADTRRTSITLLQSYLQANLDFPVGVFTNQYSSPATGFNVVVLGGNYWLIITPVGTLAAGTITLPDINSLTGNEEVLVNCTQIITTLTVVENSSNTETAVVGAPTSLAANGFFRMKYDNLSKNWYRV